MLRQRLAVLESLNRNLLYALFFIAAFGPAFFAFQAGPFHLFPFRLLWMLLLPLTIIFFFWNRDVVLERLKETKNYNIFLAIWLAYGLISLFWAICMIDAVRQIVFILIGISLVYFVVLYLRNLKHYQIIQMLWVAALAVVIAIGYWTIITGQHLPVAKLYGRIERIPSAVFTNPNDLGSYLAISLPFLMLYIKYGQKVAVKLASTIGSILALFLLVATGSRMNYLALFCGICFWFFFLSAKRERLIGITAFLAVFIVIILLPVFFQGDQVSPFIFGFNKIEGLFLLLTEEGQEMDISTGSRINFFLSSFRYLLDTYGFGVGAGNAEYYINNYQYYYTYGYSNLHNWWLEIAVNYGLFILAGFIYYYLSLIVNLFRMRKQFSLPSEIMISEALLLSLVIFFFAAMSPSSMFGFGPLWVLFAFATGFVSLYRSELGEKSAKES